ncbi:MAG: hypothetical protein DRJ10_19115 [Bacteroidetes bacterium]|nr:MAG: hypothetical protein DRJ10_19115 [Bacteroidota bacterium]
MKKIAIILTAIVLISSISTSSFAQKEKEKKKEKKVKIKLDKEVDGKHTKIDTVIVLKEGESLKDALKEYNIDVEEFSKGDIHTYKFHTSAEGEGKVEQKILIEIDEDGKHKVKSKKGHKMIFISEDGETHDFDIDENFEHVYKYKTSGDSITKVVVMSGGKHWVHEGDDNVHIMRKDDLHFISKHGNNEVWRKDAKPGDTVRIKTIVSINGKETNVNIEEIIVDEKDLQKVHKKVMIIHADTDGKHTKIKKEYIISSDNDFEWSDKDENVFIIKKDGKSSKIKIKIDDVDKNDLKKLKLPRSIKPLKVSNLFIMFNKDDKMTLSFTIEDKAKTTVRIFDENGEKLFEDVKSDFSGKYSKEIKKMKGDMIIQVSQGKKYFHKELEIEY